MKSQHLIQSLSLTLFLLALVSAPDPFLSLWPADGFLRMDPLVCLGTLVASRQFAPLLWIAGLILLLTIVLGRFFCAYLCPMGISIDVCDRMLRTHRSACDKSQIDRPGSLPPRRLKYHILIFILAAGALGVSFIFIASPLSLITKFYGLIVYPVCAYLAEMGLHFLRPVADRMDLSLVAYAVIKVPRYDGQWVTIAVLLAIFAGGLWAPRFWCRYLCPSGALLAIFARRRILRRHVSADCTQCGLCMRVCPMGAIGGDSNTQVRVTNHAECLSCLACVSGCPSRATTFSFWREPAAGQVERIPGKMSRDRRRFIGTGISGATAAIISFTGLKSPHSDPGPGSLTHPAVIRPPGAVPESAFLSRCVRCGACMRACPTNSLQPLALAAGLTAYFSPVITPRRGPCEPSCHACGTVCPTGAIAPLPKVERLKAKVGTACIARQKCLAWELEKKCLICDEVCPFDAIEFRKLPGRRIAVPFVSEHKCAGCGFCEHYCPVQAVPAIVVGPMQALRLLVGSYRTAAREKGFCLELGQQACDGAYGNYGRKKAPGSQWDRNGLPPGFSE